jgi:hypothetical protein
MQMELHNVLVLTGIGSLWFLGGMLLARINRTLQCAECPHCQQAVKDKAAAQDQANHEYEHRVGMPCKREYCRIRKDPVD